MPRRLPRHALFRARTALYAALTANALRPPPGFRAAVPAFFAGGLTGEFSPQWLAVATADVAAHLTRRRRDPVGLGLAVFSIAGLAWLVRQSGRDQQVAEQALADALGADYRDTLEHAPTPAELKTPWLTLMRPVHSLRVAGRRINVERNIAYGPAGRRNYLDVYAPATDADTGPATGAPVLLQVHGGAWIYGTKDQQGVPLMQHLAARGWVCVAINYRLAGRDPWPAQIVDVKRAIAWIRENIESYGGDPGYLAITGGSAGGHLASLAALTPNDPEFQPGFEDVDTHVEVAVPHYGVYDLAGATETRAAVQMRDLFLGRRVFPRPFEEDPEAFRRASPLLRITEEAPDVFAVHGGHDSLVPVDQARQFVAKLRETSQRSVVYAELPGAQHAFDVLPSVRSVHVLGAVERFLQWHWTAHQSGRRAGAGTA